MSEKKFEVRLSKAARQMSSEMRARIDALLKRLSKDPFQPGLGLRKLRGKFKGLSGVEMGSIG